MKALILCLLLTGCVTDCRLWVSEEQASLEPIQSSKSSDIPTFLVGSKCHF